MSEQTSPKLPICVKDITGHRFHRLVAMRYLGKRIWEFQCDCGKLTKAMGSKVRTGNTKSCGCWRRDACATHGKSRDSNGHTRLYGVWADMKSRCSNSKNRFFKDYGGRGIVVCERWQKFENFMADMGEKPKGKSIDRINNDGNYEPRNCRWATPKEQANNRR